MSLMSRWHRLVQYLQHDIWEHRGRDGHDSPPFLARLLRIVVMAARGFAADMVQLRASALTYFTLLSIVPIAALAFGIAKGFGLDAALENALRERLMLQEQVLERVVSFAHTMLEDASGGVVAGVGVLVLVWAVIRLLNNIEKSFNAIWGVTKARGWVRKLTDYLAMVVIAPILLLVASSGTVFLSASVADVFDPAGPFAQVGKLVQAALGLIPYVVIWLLLTLLYLTMPNTTVSWRAALTAGVVAGTLYQVVQFGFLQLQIGVARNNAIYGGFAALPLFLIWMHVSWIIVLLGAEVAFAVENVGRFARERGVDRTSHHRRRLLAIGITAVCARRFRSQDTPPTADDLAVILDAPVRLVHQVVETLTEAGLLVTVQDPSGGEVPTYVPARDPAATRLKDIVDACDHEGDDDEGHALPGPFNARWRALDDLLGDADENVNLATLAAEVDDRPANVSA